MADRALPIIFLNLSGEMLYVIQQRLEAQNVSEDKSNKVIEDILTTMLNDQFIEELFKPQNMYSRSAMQSVFEKLVHSSIMRLNTTSMSKLYDLMLMVFKYQVLNCRCAEDILLVTLNHMDAIRNCAVSYQELRIKVENVFFLLVSNYEDMKHLDYECLFSCITAFLQDLNIRVSVLMRLGLQLSNGEIVRCDSKAGFESSISTMQNDDYIVKGEAMQEKWKKSLPQRCFDFDGNRGISLGTNIYIKSAAMFPGLDKENDSDMNHKECNDSGKYHALEEVTLLNRLIGNSSQSEFVPDLLFASIDEESIECQKDSYEKNVGCFVTIDASQKSRNELGQLSQEFFVKEEKKGENDILELLDFADSDKI
uniref:Protein OSCP1 n=2 Tax=Parasteatoda tepidariorum TaxID=114398 RepID=A0A2L2YGU6_PARTP